MEKAENLKAWRKAKGWTQEEMASKLGTVQSTYQAWESGRASIPPEIRTKLRKMGYDGPWPDEGREITLADLESIRDEIRTQVAWAREELRKENTALAADLQEALKRLAALQGNRPA